MTETVVLLMLVGWLVCTLVMTVRSGRSRGGAAERRRVGYATDASSGGPESDLRDAALESHPSSVTP
jgi:hypothetical protein